MASRNSNPLKTAGPGGRRGWRPSPRGAAIVFAASALALATLTLVGVNLERATAGHGETGQAAKDRTGSFFTASYSAGRPAAYDTFPGVDPRPMPICRGGRQDNCVEDGNSFLLNGRRIRIANAHAPELPGRCDEETGKAREAARTLSALLGGKSIEIRALGRDRSGRLLATISTADGDVGHELIRFKVAKPWDGRKDPVSAWCATG